MRVLAALVLLFVLTACAANTSETRSAYTQSAAPAYSPLPPTAMVTHPWSPGTPLSPESSVLLQLGNEIHVLDLVTGKDVPGYGPIPVSPFAISPDMKKIAAIEPRGQSCETVGGGTSCYPGAGILNIVELQTGRSVTGALPSGGRGGWVGNVSFSPDATHVALAYNESKWVLRLGRAAINHSSTILLADTHTAQIVAQRMIDFRLSLLRYAQDEKTLVVYGHPLGGDPGNDKPPPPSVVWLDAATLDVKWEQTLANVTSGSWCVESCSASHEERLSVAWYPAVVPSNDGSKLYIVHADADRLTTIDFSSRTVRTTEIATARSWFDHFLALTANVAEAKGGASGVHKYAILSSDGARLYVSGIKVDATRDPQHRWNTTYAPIDLQMIDAASGRKSASRAMLNPDDGSEYFGNVNLTPDGGHVFVLRSSGGNWRTDVFDAQNLQPAARLDQWRMFIARRMDGQPILLAHQPHLTTLQLLGVIDPRTFEVIRSWSVDSGAGWVGP